MMGRLDDIAWGDGKRRRRYTPEQVRTLRQEYATGQWTMVELARRHKMSTHTVRSICKLGHYGEVDDDTIIR